MAVYGYIRVSTPNQNTARQEDALRGEADAVFVDKVSGASMENRPEFLKLMGKIGKGDTFLVLSLDRAFRSLRDALDTLERLDSVGADFRALDASIDTTTKQGRAFFQMAAVFAEFERGIAAERREQGIKAAKKRGVRFGRPPSLTRAQVLHATIQIGKHGKSVTEMAEVLAVDRSTLHRAIKREEEVRAIPYPIRKLAVDIGTWAIMKDLDLFDATHTLHKALEDIPRMQDVDNETFKAALDVARHMQRQPDYDKE